MGRDGSARPAGWAGHTEQWAEHTGKLRHPPTAQHTQTNQLKSTQISCCFVGLLHRKLCRKYKIGSVGSRDLSNLVLTPLFYISVFPLTFAESDYSTGNRLDFTENQINLGGRAGSDAPLSTRPELGRVTEQ